MGHDSCRSAAAVRSAASIVIKKVEAFAVAVPLSYPIKMAHKTFDKVESLVVRMESNDGVVGWGEAASAPSLTGETWQGMVAIVRDHMAQYVVGRDARLRLALMRTVRTRVQGAPGATSALEMALIDLVARSLQVPMAMLLGGLVRDYVEPMWLLGGGAIAEDIERARQKSREGYRLFKLKIGVRPVDEEIEMSNAIRAELGPDIKLCADANAGFSLASARRYLSRTQDVNLEFLEQPFAPDAQAALKTLAHESPVPLCADQSVHTIDDIVQQAGLGVDGVTFKLNKLGGLGECLKAAAVSEQLGLKAIMAAKIAETSIASAAIVQISCVMPSIEWGVSLSHVYLAEDIVKDPLMVANGRVDLPSGSGLGVVIDQDALDRLRIA